MSKSLKFYLTGLVFLGLAGLSFWAIFFKLTGYICSLLPVTDWTPILKLLIIIFVGYGGGLLIPLIFIFIGCIAIIEGCRIRNRI